MGEPVVRLRAPSEIGFQIEANHGGECANNPEDSPSEGLSGFARGMSTTATARSGTESVGRTWPVEAVAVSVES
ncbi:hypothetical protein ACFFQF_12740 [Haladaptatus pallidirubidus]|uniref:hypothetical protein n=1 Tax=Haladaptatus pallidirubidus TaxID=1008152 RepID=UPI001D12E9F6|nr:hypothetical protein [Haladaptatus pallidirubidus]